jgi:hypothetical protein
MSWPNKVYSQSMVPKYTKYNDTNMLFRYSGVKRDGKYLDASGNGNASTSTIQTSDGKKRITSATTRSAVNSPITGATVLPRTQSHSMGSFVNLVVPAGTQVTVFGKGVTGAWSYYPAGGISITNTGLIRVTWYSGGADYTYVDYLMGTNTTKVKHMLYVIDHAAGFGYLYINGVLAASNTPTTITAAVDYAVEPFKLFTNGSTITNSEIGISLKDCTLWSRALVAADVRKEWLQYAPMVQLKTGWGAKISIANESTVGNFVGNGSTPFEILSGTWKTSVQTVDGELHKVVECVAAGTVWLDRHFMNIDSTEASYGSWRLSYGHAKDTVNVAHIGLTSTSKAAWDAASNTGYVLRLSATAAGDKLLRYSGGGAANLCFNMPNSSATTNQVQITRRFDNVWQGYQTPYIVAANALLTPPWAPSTDGPFTDATYTTSEGMSFTFNPGDWVSLGTVRDTYALTKFLGEFDPREV